MTLLERQQLNARIDEGVREGVAAALEEHARAGRDVAIWRDGKVVVLPARQLLAEKDGHALRESSD